MRIIKVWEERIPITGFLKKLTYNVALASGISIVNSDSESMHIMHYVHYAIVNTVSVVIISSLLTRKFQKNF